MESRMLIAVYDHLQNNRYNEAITAILEKMKGESKNASLLELLGYVYLTKYENEKLEVDYDRALELFNKILPLKDVNKDIFFRVGKLFVLHGEFGKGLAQLTHYYQLPNPNPRCGSEMQALLRDYADNIFDSIDIEEDSENCIHSCMQWGHLFSRFEMREIALKFARKAVESEPSNEQALYFYLNSCCWAGQRKEAISLFTEFVEQAKDLPVFYYYRGLAYAGMFRGEDALKDFDEAIRLNPSNHEYYYGRGCIQAELKNFDAAIEDVSKAIEINPMDVKYLQERDALIVKKDEQIKMLESMKEPSPQKLSLRHSSTLFSQNNPNRFHNGMNKLKEKIEQTFSFKFPF